MEWRDATKPFHLDHRKIAHADGADFPLCEQHVHCVRSFFDRNQRIGPVNLIDINVVGSKPAQGILDFAQDAGTAGIARYSSTLPLKSDLGSNNDVRAQAALGDRLANDLFRMAESIDRSRVHKIDAMLERGLDGSNRFGFVGSTPHPPADGPSPNSDGRHPERRAGDFRRFHVQFERFCLMIHYFAPSQMTWACPRRTSPAHSPVVAGTAESPASSAAISPREVQSRSP